MRNPLESIPTVVRAIGLIADAIMKDCRIPDNTNSKLARADIMAKLLVPHLDLELLIKHNVEPK